MGRHFYLKRLGRVRVQRSRVALDCVLWALFTYFFGVIGYLSRELGHPLVIVIITVRRARLRV